MKVNSPFMQAPVQKSPEEKLQQVSDMYEKHFLGEMLKAMRSTVQEGGFVKANNAEKIFRDQLDSQYVEKWGDKGGIGLSKMIYQQLVDKFGVQMGIKKPIDKPQGPLGVGQKDNFTGLNTRSASRSNSVAGQSPSQVETLSYRFDRVPLEKPELGVAPAAVQSPWGGMLLNKIALGPDENLVEIGHDNGLKSQIVFKGALSKLSTGQNLQAGDTLGVLSPEAKSVFWNVHQEGPAPESPVSE